MRTQYVQVDEALLRTQYVQLDEALLRTQYVQVDEALLRTQYVQLDEALSRCGVGALGRPKVEKIMRSMSLSSRVCAREPHRPLCSMSDAVT